MISLPKLPYFHRIYIHGYGQPYAYSIFGREITEYTVIYNVYIYMVLANSRKEGTRD